MKEDVGLSYKRWSNLNLRLMFSLTDLLRVSDLALLSIYLIPKLKFNTNKYKQFIILSGYINFYIFFKNNKEYKINKVKYRIKYLTYKAY